MQSRSLRPDGHAETRRTLTRKRCGDGGPGRNAGFTISAMALAGMLLLVLSCGDGAVEPPPPPQAPVPTTVTVNPASASLTALEETTRLTAEVRDQNGQVMAGAAVAWASSDASVVSVDASGLVTAAANGSATVTATAGPVSGTASVTVAQVVSAVAVSPATDTLVAFGDTVRLVAEATDANGHGVAAVTEFVWSSSDTLVARVDDSGLVESLAEGEAVVMATAAEVTGGTELSVVPPLPTTIAVSPDTLRLSALGQTAQLTAEVREQAGRVMAEALVSWSSGDTLVVAVESGGRVTAVGGGTTVVTAAAGDVSDAVVATVVQSAGSVVVSPDEGTIALGDTLRLAAEAFDENGHRVDGAEFLWSSSDGATASVDDSGLVTGLGEGTARITARAGDVAGVAEITVENPDRAALVALYEATDGPNWTRNENWLSDAPLGTWHGVQTDSTGRVVSLVLGGNALTGTVPPQLGLLTSLRSIQLQVNFLTGPIPPELGNLANLEWLSLTRNNFSGTIPAELGNLAKLRGLILNWNYSLTGPVPHELAALPDLRVLWLQTNSFTGSIPLAFLRSSLEELRFHENDGLCISGSADFVDWTATLDRFEGPYCNESDRASLEQLYRVAGGSAWLNSSNWLTDTPLDDWYGVGVDTLGRARTLDLSRNQLSGSFPSAVADLAVLAELRIGGNALSGRLPLSLARLGLVVFHYSETDLCAPSDAAFSQWLSGISSHEGTGVQCAPLSDRDRLIALYEATDGPGWTTSTGWLSDSPLGSWHGVAVDGDGGVVRLALPDNALTGWIPVELAGLARLTDLSLSGNSLTGVIPPGLGNLAGLQRLDLDDNALTGPIPPELRSHL